MEDRYIRRTPGVSFIEREPDVVQFGIDATRAGLVRVDNAAKVVQTLNRLPVVTSVSTLSKALALTGMPLTSAYNLVQELRAFGLWRDTGSYPTVGVWGLSPLAHEIARGLKQDGFMVHMPLESPKADADSLLRASRSVSSANAPVFIVDLLHLAQKLAASSTGQDATWIPVTSLDTRVMIGPLRRNGTGPCMTCFNLHRAELDPQWFRLVKAQTGQWPVLDAPVTATAVAQVVLLARSLTQVRELPGATPVRWLPGELLEVDAYGQNQQRFLEPHPHCPFCFAAIHNPGARVPPINPDVAQPAASDRP